MGGQSVSSWRHGEDKCVGVRRWSWGRLNWGLSAPIAVKLNYWPHKLYEWDGLWGLATKLWRRKRWLASPVSPQTLHNFSTVDSMEITSVKQVRWLFRLFFIWFLNYHEYTITNHKFYSTPALSTNQIADFVLSMSGMLVSPISFPYSD